MKKPSKPSKIDRTKNILLENAMSFCQADAEVQLACRQWKGIHELHNSEAIDYDNALRKRSAAKTAMQRAYKRLLELNKN